MGFVVDVDRNHHELLLKVAALLLKLVVKVLKLVVARQGVSDPCVAINLVIYTALKQPKQTDDKKNKWRSARHVTTLRDLSTVRSVPVGR